MPQYYIRQDGNLCHDMPGLNDAIAKAEELLASAAGLLTTFTVENEDGYLLAGLTNQSVIGTFTKQQWIDDEAAYVGDEVFDATDYILCMAGKDVRALVDGKESTDPVGLAHVSWDGPFRVQVVESLLGYFGVCSMQEVTDELLAFAKNRLNPQQATEQTLQLTIQVRVLIAPGADVSSFVNDLEHSVVSNTVGITVQGTELVCGT